MEAFFIVSEKVLIMSVIIIIGFIVTKLKKLGQKGSEDFTWFLMTIISPAVIIDAFATLEAGSLSPMSLLFAVFIPVLIVLSCFAMSFLFFKKEKPERKKVLRFATIFSNTGFMGIPLASAILGARGVVFASVYVAVFNFLLWTFGYALMTGEKKIQFKKIFLNPGTIGFAIGLVIYFTGVQLPVVATEPITYLASMNMPIAMIILGYFMAQIKFKEVLTDLALYKVSLLRLVVFPLFTLLFLFILKPEYHLFISATIQSCTPAATTTVMLAAITKADAKLASTSVVITTIFSLLTVPVFSMLAEMLADAVL